MDENEERERKTVRQTRRTWKKDPKAMMNSALQGRGRRNRGGRRDGTGQSEPARRTGIPQQTINNVLRYSDERVTGEPRTERRWRGHKKPPQGVRRPEPESKKTGRIDYRRRVLLW